MFSLHGEAIFESQTALSDPYCEVEVAPNHLFNTSTCTTSRTYLVSVPQSNRIVCMLLFIQWLLFFSLLSPLPSAMHGRGVERKGERFTCDSFSLRHVSLLSQPLRALSLPSPLSGSIRSTSSSWPHCVVAVSLFNLSFSLPRQPALSYNPFLTPFLVYTQSVGLFFILLIPRSSPLSGYK